MLGARKTTFYSSLLDLPGIVSVPPLEFSNDVAAIADVVLMGSGSVGIESFIRGKPIVTYCDTSFWFIPANAAYVDLGKLCDWPSVIADKIRIHTVPTQDQRLDFVRQCLRSTVRQERPGRIWPICVPSELRLALQAALPN